MKNRFSFLILAVLLSVSACENGSTSKDVTLIEPHSEGAIIFKKFCSACHAPPRITSHKADEWLNIVDRMQTHRVKKAYNPLNESEKAILVAYLQKHSAE